MERILFGIWSVPFSTGAVPFGIGSVPFSTGAVPFAIASVPFSTGSAPFGIGTVPFSTGSTPFGIGTVPFSSGSVPFGISRTPYRTGAIAIRERAVQYPIRSIPISTDCISVWVVSKTGCMYLYVCDVYDILNPHPVFLLIVERMGTTLHRPRTSLTKIQSLKNIMEQKQLLSKESRNYRLQSTRSCRYPIRWYR